MGDMKDKMISTWTLVTETLTEKVIDPLAKRLAAAIDYYVRNANVYGTIITTGSPVTQMAAISSPTPLTNGKIPNTFGIQ